MYRTRNVDASELLKWRLICLLISGASTLNSGNKIISSWLFFCFLFFVLNEVFSSCDMINFRSFLILLLSDWSRRREKKRKECFVEASFWFQSWWPFIIHLEMFFADELSSFNAITIYLNVSQVERMEELEKRWKDFKPLSWRQLEDSGRKMDGKG